MARALIDRVQRDAGRDWFFFPEQREVTGTYVLCRRRRRCHRPGRRATAAPGSTSDVPGLERHDERGRRDVGDRLDPGRLGEPAGARVRPRHHRSAYDLAGEDQGDLLHRRQADRADRPKYECGRASRASSSGSTCTARRSRGQTPDDIIYINHDDTPGVEYAAPEDFGDQPLGTTVVRQFRLKNASATKTANTDQHPVQRRRLRDLDRRHHVGRDDQHRLARPRRAVRHDVRPLHDAGARQPPRSALRPDRDDRRVVGVGRWDPRTTTSSGPSSTRSSAPASAHRRRSTSRSSRRSRPRPRLAPS